MSRRIERINELIKKELGKIFMEELDLPRDLLLTVTSVETSADLSLSKIWLSVFPFKKKDEIFKIINRGKKEIRDILFGEKINLRIAPRVLFLVDEGEEKRDKINRIFNKIKNGK